MYKFKINLSRCFEEKKSIRYTNYSETDEEQVEEEINDDEEYDSDMADFIDDTVVDDLQREDFEESLRFIILHFLKINKSLTLNFFETKLI